MKFFAIFATLLAVTCALPRQWTVLELTEAIQSPYTDPTMLPYLESHLNELMSAMNEEELAASLMPIFEPVPTLDHWEFSTWTLNELSDALQDPNTDPALLPYLESALNALMDGLISGQQQETVVIATPVGLLPVEVTPVTPAVTPEASASASSPLVQIIINVKEQQAAPAPVPVAPVPVNPIVMPPQPINPIDVIAITPPESIINPVDVIAIYPPEAIINPVDVVAITPPESIINPIDVIAISPVVPSVVGPI